MLINILSDSISEIIGDFGDGGEKRFGDEDYAISLK